MNDPLSSNLVAELREALPSWTGAPIGRLIHQAADAIERLTRERDEYAEVAASIPNLIAEREEALNCIRGGTYVQKEWVPNIVDRLEAERDRLEELTSRQSKHIIDVAHDNGLLRAALERAKGLIEHAPDDTVHAPIWRSMRSTWLKDVEALAGAAVETTPANLHICGTCGAEASSDQELIAIICGRDDCPARHL